MAAPSPPARSGGAVRALAWVGGVLGGLALAYLLILWLFPASRVEGALLGPVGPVVALVVGAVSFFSPCVLPLLPGYLSYVSGLSGEELGEAAARKRVLLATVLFVLGFATMFTALGVAVSAVGQALLENQLLLTRIGGAVVILMGVAFALPGVIPALERERRPLMSRVRPGVGGAYLLGLAFAVGWAPCVGPGLGVILTLGFSEGSVARAAVLLFSFSLGFGIWFVLSGLAVRRALAATAWMRRRARLLQTVGGVFMVAIGVLLLTGVWETVIAPLRRWTATFAPPV